MNNFNSFRLESEVPEAVVIAMRQEEDIYMKLVREQEEGNFIGIAVVNYR